MPINLHLDFWTRRAFAATMLAFAMLATAMVPAAALPDRIEETIDWVVPDAIQGAFGVSAAEAWPSWGDVWDTTKQAASSVGNGLWTGARSWGTVTATSYSVGCVVNWWSGPDSGCGATGVAIATAAQPVATTAFFGGFVYGTVTGWNNWGN